MEKIKLTGAEWSVLDCLWEESPLTVMQMVARMRDRVGWAKSTTITVLRRMEDKGQVHCEIVGRGKAYTPAVEKEKAVISETRSFLDKVYGGRLGLMMSAMVDSRALTQQDIDELTAILESAKEGN